VELVPFQKERITFYWRRFNVTQSGRILKAHLSWSLSLAKFCHFITNLSVFLSFFFALKSDLKTSSLSFVSLGWSRTTDKLAINWQSFVQVRLQFKFAFVICRKKGCLHGYNLYV